MNKRKWERRHKGQEERKIKIKIDQMAGEGRNFMDQMAKGLLFGAAVLSQARRLRDVSPLPQHPSIGSGFGWQQMSWMKWECLFWRRKAGTGHIASLVWNESPVSRQADRRWIGQRWEKKKMNNIREAYKPTLKI